LRALSVDAVFALPQGEASDSGLKGFAIFLQHLVAALHGAEGSLERTARGVFETLAFLQHRLLAHHSRPTHLFDLSVGIGDDPVTVEQLHGVAPLIGDANSVPKTPLASTVVG